MIGNKGMESFIWAIIKIIKVVLLMIKLKDKVLFIRLMERLLEDYGKIIFYKG